MPSGLERRTVMARKRTCLLAQTSPFMKVRCSVLSGTFIGNSSSYAGFFYLFLLLLPAYLKLFTFVETAFV